MPDAQASYGSSARTSGSTLRISQQRSGSRSQRFGDRDHLGPDEVHRVALQQPVARLVALAEEEVRVQLDDVDRQAELGDHVDQHRRLLLPRAGQAEAVAELLVTPDEQVLGGDRLARE
jgi:hypothetical protein